MKFSWRNRLLLSYLPAFFILGVILILIFFMSISEFSKQEARKANEIYVKRMLEIVDSSLTSIDQSITKEVMSNDKFALYFKHASADSYFNDFEVSKVLTDLQRYVPLIDSVYLYRSSDQKLLTEKSSPSFSEFGDRPFLLNLIQNEIPKRYTGVRTFAEYAESAPARPVVTLVKRMLPPFGNEGFIVVNIRTESLRKLVEPMLDSKISRIDFYDDNGSFLFGTSGTEAAAGPPPASINKVTADYTHWVGVSSFSDKHLFGVFSLLNYVWVSIGAAALLAGGFWIFFITRKNVQPVQKIMEHIYKYAQGGSLHLSGKAGNDEFKFIETGVHHLIEQSIRYKEQNEENQVYRSRHLFQELLEGKLTIHPAGWGEVVRHFGFSGEDEGFAVVVVEMDKYAEFTQTYHLRDQHLLKFVISRVVKEISHNHDAPVWTEWIDAHRLGALFAIADSESDQERIHRVARETIQWVAANLPFTVTIGIGSMPRRLEEIPACYDDALEALQYKSTLGNNRLLDYAQVGRQPVHKDIFKNLQSIRSITQSFRVGDESWKQHHAAAFEEMKSHPLPKDELVSMMNYMIFQMYRESMDLSEELRQVWEQRLPEFSVILEQFDTVEELDSRFYEVLSRTAEEIKNIRESKTHYQLVGEMKKFIEAHFADPDLSLSLLSDQFELHPNYLSRLFKEEFGEKFIDYVTNMRIERAKELLAETNLSIQEIASQVGYSLPVSFIRVFKKHVGTTPGDYRKGIQA
ncbi:helix-turn-helix domain-containing protein [Paenibacillus thalictri]|uniref:AraC family transcriptional regulator n=1 Tax=Paenibacillus thalictri TaxID=2527873 RepID=A0A4Q9DHZ4_9BACL|nr:helix-turn-helix domain-containing protein [Paenibacillus thalictri]TBL71606.1 AraC family transcriptional regulator [Paenibacillus thalictri]